MSLFIASLLFFSFALILFISFGIHLFTAQELAGLGGDVRFLKQHVGAQWHTPIPFLGGSGSVRSLPDTHELIYTRRLVVQLKRVYYGHYMVIVPAPWTASF